MSKITELCIVENVAAKGMVRAKTSFLSHLKRLSYSLAALL